MLAAVIGSPVRHSLSPAIHNSAFGHAGRPWHFFAADVDSRTLPAMMEAVRELPFGGLSVTTPLKEAVIGLLDDVTSESERLRSVNCIRVHEGRLTGHLTDGVGCADALRAAGVGIDGARIVVLGAGATARAITSALCASGADVVVVNRSTERAAELCARVTSDDPSASVSTGSASDIPGARVVVNATTVGMNSNPEGPSLVDGALLSPAHTVLDAVYQPLVTPLSRVARERGATVVDGLWMLIHQAVRQQMIWFGEDAVDGSTMAGTMRTAAERELALRRR